MNKKPILFWKREITKLNYGIVNVIESSNVRRYGPSTINHQSHAFVRLLLLNDKNTDEFNGKQSVYVMCNVRASSSFCFFFFSSKVRFQINFIYTNNFRHFQMHVSSHRAKIIVYSDSYSVVCVCVRCALCVCTSEITQPFDHEKCIRPIFSAFSSSSFLRLFLWDWFLQTDETPNFT